MVHPRVEPPLRPALLPCAPPSDHDIPVLWRQLALGSHRIVLGPRPLTHARVRRKVGLIVARLDVTINEDGTWCGRAVWSGAMKGVNVEEDDIASFTVDTERIVKCPVALDAKVRWGVHVRQVAEFVRAGDDEEGSVVEGAVGVDGVAECGDGTVGDERGGAIVDGRAEHEVCRVLMQVCDTGVADQ